MLSKILFTDTKGIPKRYYPITASLAVPEWYKKTESYISGEKRPNGQGGSTATIKKCMPVFDAITSGYLILSPADIFVSQQDGAPYFEWSSHDLISFHPVEQAPLHPAHNGYAYPKWNNPWSIKTPKGYSVLFTQPMHRESPFTILDGIVDTDTYFAPVNFPFVLNDPFFEGLIPAGTPIAQIIPIKRNSWKIEYGNEQDFKNQGKITVDLITTFFDRYKKKFWHRKEYK